jgi:hypothetical protein
MVPILQEDGLTAEPVGGGPKSLYLNSVRTQTALHMFNKYIINKKNIKTKFNYCVARDNDCSVPGTRLIHSISLNLPSVSNPFVCL